MKKSNSTLCQLWFCWNFSTLFMILKLTLLWILRIILLVQMNQIMIMLHLFFLYFLWFSKESYTENLLEVSSYDDLIILCWLPTSSPHNANLDDLIVKQIIANHLLLLTLLFMRYIFVSFRNYNNLASNHN